MSIRFESVTLKNTFFCMNRIPAELMQTVLPIITNQECNYLYGGRGPNPNFHICTFDGRRTRAACRGDEGGPLVYENRLLGILLFTGWQTWTHPDVFVNFNNLDIHNSVNFHMNVVRRAH